MLKVDYKYYLLGILTLVGVVSVFDRFVFALAMEPIKQDLDLTDSQLGLMTGIAFAAFYAIAGIPIARWADRGNRVTIVSLSIGLLGAMLSLCGLVANFFQLLLIRSGIAVGEAGSMPAIQSLLADYFDRAERPQAMAIFFMAYPISMIVGYLAGGYFVENLGWRGTFMLLGIPGVLAALLVKLTLKEPRLAPKAAPQPSASAVLQQPTLAIVLKVLWKKPTFRHLLMSFCVSYFFMMGTSQWLATFFIRTHNMSAAELGGWLALSWGVFGMAGNYLGGYCATHYAAKKEGLQMRALAIVVMVYGVVNALIYLSPHQSMALFCVALSALLGTLGNGTLFSALQSLVDERMRSTTIALVFLFANLIGFGLGPLALGVMSDLLNPMFGQDSLRYALVLFSPGAIWVAIHYWKAGNTIQADIMAVEAKPSGSDGVEPPVKIASYSKGG